MVLLADGEGAEHGGVGIGKLTEAAVGIADDIEGIHQLLRLWVQRRLNCWHQAVHGGAGLGEPAGIHATLSGDTLDKPAHDVCCRCTGRGKDLQRSIPLPRFQLGAAAHGLVGGEPVSALPKGTGERGEKSGKVSEDKKDT